MVGLVYVHPLLISMGFIDDDSDDNGGYNVC